jgi:hypothetical protein
MAVCEAIIRTLAIVSDLTAYRADTPSVAVCLQDISSVPFVEGMVAFRRSYDGDMDVSIQSDRVVLAWESIMRRLDVQPPQPPAQAVSAQGPAQQDPVHPRSSA